MRTEDYNLYIENCEGKARTCIKANKKLNVFMLHIYINQDTTTIIWETDRNKYRLVSCYMPYEEEEVPSQLIKELLRDSEASIIA